MRGGEGGVAAMGVGVGKRGGGDGRGGGYIRERVGVDMRDGWVVVMGWGWRDA